MRCSFRKLCLNFLQHCPILITRVIIVIKSRIKYEINAVQQEHQQKGSEGLAMFQFDFSVVIANMSIVFIVRARYKANLSSIQIKPYRSSKFQGEKGKKTQTV